MTLTVAAAGLFSACCLLAADELPRRDIWKLKADDPDIVALKAAIQKMKQIDSDSPSDCLGWTFQADIHGGMNHKPAIPGDWTTCQHGTYHFLAWHRMYIYYFEKNVQTLSDRPEFRLPYWNWSAGDTTLPPHFNDLFGVKSIGDQTPGLAQIFSLTRFFHVAGNTGPRSFGGLQLAPMHSATGGGQMETGPHRQVHDQLKLPMSYPGTAALDPVFFLHHSNVDRLWESWLKCPGRSNPTVPAWLDEQFTFCEADPMKRGQRKAAHIGDFLNTQSRGYYYDSYLYEEASCPVPQPDLAWTNVASAAVPGPLGANAIPITLTLNQNTADTQPQGWRVVFHDLRWDAPVGARYMASILTVGKEAPIPIGYLNFYRFDDNPANHGDHGEQASDFTLSERGRRWLQHSAGKPIQLQLEPREETSDRPGKPKPKSRPTVRRVEILAGH